MGQTPIEFFTRSQNRSIFLDSVSQATKIMLRLIVKLFPFKAIKLFLRFLASLASAIVIVSGYLLFISNNERNEENDSTSNENEVEENNITEESD